MFFDDLILKILSFVTVYDVSSIKKLQQQK